MVVNVDVTIEDWVGSFPQVFVKLTERLDDLRSSFKGFSASIERDYFPAACLLKVVNRAFNGMESVVETSSIHLEL